MKKTGIIVLIIVILLVIFGLTRDTGEPISEEPVKIGILGPFTGPLADYGEEIQRGVLSVDTSGVELIFEDTLCDARKTLDAYKKLVELNKAKFIIGPGCGAPQGIIAPLVADDGVLAIVPSAAARSLHKISDGHMFFTQYALEDESKFIAEKMLELGHEKVVLISFKNAFSETHVKSFRENFRGEIVAELSFLSDTTDVASELIKIKDVEADAIFSTDISFLFAQGAARMEQYGIDLPIFSQYATELPAVRDLVVDGMIYSFPGDVGGEGAIFEFSKISAENMFNVIRKCDGDVSCATKDLKDSGDYNEFGVRDQAIILKQIVNGEAVEI